MSPGDTLKERREDVLWIAAAHGAHNVRVFGSVVRHEADEKSDIDLLVDMAPGRSLFDMGALLMDLQELLGYPVDIVTEAALRERHRESILLEAAPV